VTQGDASGDRASPAARVPTGSVASVHARPATGDGDLAPHAAGAEAPGTHAPGTPPPHVRGSPSHRRPSFAHPPGSPRVPAPASAAAPQFPNVPRAQEG
jgi:hypothetical protein